MNSPNEFGQRPSAGGSYDFDAEDDALDLLAYWHIVNRHKWPILGLTLVVGVLVYVVVSALTPIYQATAKLLIESREANIVSIEQVYGVDTTRRDYYETQFQVMQSREVLEGVVDQLELYKEPSFDPNRPDDLSLGNYLPFLSEPPRELSEEERRQAAIGQLGRNLTVSPVRNTQVVDIQFKSPDPELAARVANTLGEVYIESYLEAQLELTQKASTWLSDRLDSMRVDLEESEQRLQQFQERENLVDVSGVKTLTANQLKDLNSRLVEAEDRVAETRSQLKTVQDTSGSYSQRWETLPDVLDDSLARELKKAAAEARNNFNETAQRYGPKHPEYINAESRLNAAEEAFEERVTQVVRGFEDDYQQAVAERMRIGAEIEERKQELQEIERKQYRLSELRRDAETNRELYDMFFRRFRETNQTSFESANARFIEQARPPSTPVEPKKGLAVGLGVLLSLAAGIGLAFVRDALDNTIKVASEVEEKLGQVVLGVVPLIERPKDKDTIYDVATMYLEDTAQSFAESVRSLRTSVVLSNMETPAQVIVVTSSVPAEGKTTVASNLALAMGQMGKVLLIDADMRRPSLGAAYGLEPRRSGLSELVAQTASMNECVHRCQEQGIDLLPSGTVPPNPLELLSSPRFAQVLSKLKEHYERIIIDSPPTQAVSDSMVLSTHADALIYVVKSDATAANVISNGLQRLQRIQAPLIGVVLNQFDPKAAQKYGYDGYSKSGYYAYGYASKRYDSETS